MRFEEYREYDALGLAELVAAAQVKPEELVEIAIAAIARDNPTLNAVVQRMDQVARKRARETLTGPFRGVPMLLKDLLAAYAGVPLSSGSKYFEGWAPGEHSELVERFLSAGVVIVGKASTSEFGLMPVTEPSRFGAVRNPWNLARTAGGSSGGSAAAVASGWVPLASGGDGGGSIRIPASCCGVFGFKPTRGRNPTGPYVEAWEGFAQEHVLTRSVRDSAAMLDVTNAAPASGPYFTPAPARSFLTQLRDAPARLRIAYSSAPLLGRTTHEDCRRAVEDAVALLRDLGHELVEAAPRVSREEFALAWSFMMGGQVAADIREARAPVGRQARRSDFDRVTWLTRLLGEALTAPDYVQAVRQLKRMGRDFELFLSGYDVWLCPTLGKPPVPHGAFERTGLLALVEQLIGKLGSGKLVLWSGQIVETALPLLDFVSYTPLANMGGQPSMSVPLYWNDERLPIGVLVTARFGEDATLLKLAQQLEGARPWAGQRPSTA